MNWIIEDSGFANGDILLPALKKLGKQYCLWSDDFWKTEEYKSFPKNSIFHGSLGNASRIKKELDFSPGSLCDEKSFSYSYIYKNFGDYVLTKNVLFTTIDELLRNKKMVDIVTGSGDRFFTRPNSPLKEFSGRILDKNNITPAHFDYGFYHSNMDLEIVIAEVRKIEKEYRYVCINDKIVTGCEYLADGRKGLVAIRENNGWEFAQEIADLKSQNDFAYIIDVCESHGKLCLVEMNPFSGADLYCCDAEKIVEEII
jgi:hypothetical protein